MKLLRNNKGAAYLSTAVLISAALAFAGAYFGKIANNTSDEVKGRIKKDNVEQKMEVKLKQHSQLLSNALKNKEQGKIDSFNCVDSNPTFKVDINDPLIEYSCEKMTSGDKVGFVITSKKKAKGISLIKKAFVPFGKPVGEVVQISSTDVSRVNTFYSEINSNLKDSMTIYEGDIITTKVNEFVKILLKDQSSIMIGPNSKFGIPSFELNLTADAGKREGIFHQFYGTIRALINKNIPINTSRNIKIKTPTISLGVRGTEFIITVIDKGNGDFETTVVLIEGEVEMTRDPDNILLVEGKTEADIDSTEEKVIYPSITAPPEEMVQIFLDETDSGRILYHQKDITQKERIISEIRRRYTLARELESEGKTAPMDNWLPVSTMEDVDNSTYPTWENKIVLSTNGSAQDVTPDEEIKCKGNSPSNANLCPNDKKDLLKSIDKLIVTSCTTERKCEYTCKDNFNLNDGACVAEVGADESFSCTGPSIANAAFCPGHDQGLTSNKENKVKDECHTGHKCEWTCKDGFKKDGDKCIAEVVEEADDQVDDTPSTNEFYCKWRRITSGICVDSFTKKSCKDKCTVFGVYNSNLRPRNPNKSLDCDNDCEGFYIFSACIGLKVRKCSEH